ncbi:hypothetical protein R1flu_010338 [Riccia fluitans]|uniref:Uncharacterized protein n=1 Tax=Riccia fluitans TaxID=41844 RepID=A0ABD1Z513_9MARC
MVSVEVRSRTASAEKRKEETEKNDKHHQAERKEKMKGIIWESEAEDSCRSQRKLVSKRNKRGMMSEMAGNGKSQVALMQGLLGWPWGGTEQCAGGGIDSIILAERTWSLIVGAENRRDRPTHCRGEKGEGDENKTLSHKPKAEGRIL